MRGEFILHSLAFRLNISTFKRFGVKLSSVRLACVKHAASVRPEPGSNSPIKYIEEPIRLLIVKKLFQAMLEVDWFDLRQTRTSGLNHVLHSSLLLHCLVFKEHRAGCLSQLL